MTCAAACMAGGASQGEAGCPLRRADQRVRELGVQEERGPGRPAGAEADTDRRLVLLRRAIHHLVSAGVQNCQGVLRYTEPDQGHTSERMTLQTRQRPLLPARPGHCRTSRLSRARRTAPHPRSDRVPTPFSMPLSSQVTVPATGSALCALWRPCCCPSAGAG
ncbi:hypothetical protein E6R18_01705 [Streptomyces sp. A1277]|nr:hypothetical protein E6R18_01705 [Streptomyces sp. A1277]